MSDIERKVIPDPPRNLGAIGRQMWIDVLRQYDLRVDERVILKHACHEMDLIERMETEQSRDELTSHGYNGQPVPAPLVGELRQHRISLKTLLAQLKLPDTPAGAARKRADVSEQARKAARARWGSGAGKTG